MKVIKVTKKKKVDTDNEGSSFYKSEKESSSVAGWAVTDPSQYKALSKMAKMQSRRAPELWVPADTHRVVRFVDTEPVVGFEAYNLKVSGKWRTFIKPAEGKTDVFANSLGLKPQRKFVWRVIDVDGYTDKKGKSMKNVPRFYVTGARNYDQIMMLADESESDAGGLNEFDVKIIRAGSGTNTTYSYMPRRPTPLTPEMKKAIAKFPKWEEYYRPPSKSEQMALLGSLGRSDDSSDD